MNGLIRISIQYMRRAIRLECGGFVQQAVYYREMSARVDNLINQSNTTAE